MLFSQIIPPSPSPTESKSLFFTSVSLSLSHILGHHYHLSKFHIYVLICCTGVFLAYFTLYNGLQFHPAHYNWFKCILLNSWIKFHWVYVPQLSYPFVCQWTSRLLPCLLQTVLRWTLGYMCLFQFRFPWCVCPAVGLLGHMAVLFPVF